MLPYPINDIVPSRPLPGQPNNIFFNVNIDLGNEVKFFQNFMQDSKSSCKNDSHSPKHNIPFKPNNFEKTSVFPLIKKIPSKKNNDGILSFKSQNNSNELANTKIILKNMAQKFLARLSDFSTIKRLPKNPFNLFKIISDKSNFPPSKKNQDSVKKLKFTTFLRKIYKRLNEKYTFIIHPYSNLKILWDFLHFFIMIFMFLLLPLDLVFEIQASFSIRIFLSIFMLFDNFLGFQTAIFHHGKLIIDRKSIAKKYVKTFIFDILTQICLNFDILFIHHDPGIKKIEFIFERSNLVETTEHNRQIKY